MGYESVGSVQFERYIFMLDLNALGKCLVIQSDIEYAIKVIKMNSSED